MPRSALNHSLMIMHLAEAREQLDDLIAELAELDAGATESDVFYQFMHLYHHVNSAWHVRHEREDYATTLTDAEFDRNQQFPVDDFEFMNASEEDE